jgi:hypothetical protein
MTQPPTPADVRFELAFEVVVPDGTRTRIDVIPVPNRCLICSNLLVKDARVIPTMFASVNGQIGFTCTNHPGNYIGPHQP